MFFSFFLFFSRNKERDIKEKIKVGKEERFFFAVFRMGDSMRNL